MNDVNVGEGFSKRHSLLLYTAISFLVLIEVYLFPVFIIPRNYLKILGSVIGPILIALSTLLVVFAVMALFLFGKDKAVIRKIPSKRFILLHFLFFTLFLSYVSYLISAYPLEPVPESSLLLQFVRRIKPDAEYLTFRYRTAYIIMAIFCHSSLILSEFKVSRVTLKYFFSFLISTVFNFFFFASYFCKAHVYNLWYFLSSGVGSTLLWIFRILGFENTTLEFLPDISPPGQFPTKNPVISTGIYKVSIGAPCSGIEGIFTFLVALAVILFLDWKRLNKKRVAVMGLAGVPVMYLTNIVRIFILLLIGHFYDPELASGLFHSYLGMFLYLVVIMAIFISGYKWMIKK
jgi:exosortase/archaeosortase family protein